MLTVEGVLIGIIATVLGTIASAATIVPYSMVKADSYLPSGSLGIYLAVVGGSPGAGLRRHPPALVARHAHARRRRGERGVSRIRTGPSPAPPSGDGPSLALPRGLPRGWEGVRTRLGRAVRDTMVGALIAAGALASVVLFVTTTYFTILCLIGIGFLALPHLTTAVRRVCDLNRRAAARSGVPVERPYRPEPQEIERDIVGWVRRCKWILADPASWRDLLWLLLNSVVGLLLGCAPAALLYYAGEGLALACGLWRPVAADGVGRWYAFITVDSWPAALAAGLAACAVFAGWLLLSPWLLKGYAYFVLFLLARPSGPAWRPGCGTWRRRAPARSTSRPPNCAARTRSARRRPGPAGQSRPHPRSVDRQLDRDAEEARRLLHDARSPPVQALRELRGLVRGIHRRCSPSADSPTPYGRWGLASPLPVTVTAELPGAARPGGVRRLLLGVGAADHALKHGRRPTGRGRSPVRGRRLRGRSPTTAEEAPRCRPGACLEGIRRRLASFDRPSLEINSPPAVRPS
ncbi:sensor domain-containing protein [Streptomyces flavovirens]